MCIRDSYKCEITATAFDPAITAKEQKRLIEKEVENGAEAILIEPLDDKKVAQELKKVGKKVPVVQINSWIRDEAAKDIERVHVDYHKMGEELARKVQKDVGSGGKILLLKSDMNYADIEEACQGVKDYLNCLLYTSVCRNMGCLGTYDGSDHQPDGGTGYDEPFPAERIPAIR